MFLEGCTVKYYRFCVHTTNRSAINIFTIKLGKLTIV